MSAKSDWLDDLNSACRMENVDLSQLDGKTILVTGATGLIGSTVVKFLVQHAKVTGQRLHILSLVRSLEKAKQVFSGEYFSQIDFVVGDVNRPLEIEGPVEYVIHAASQTSSRAFVNEPVETIRTAVQGTINLLELAREKSVKSFVYLSSMEVYGSPQSDVKITEEYPSNLDTMSVRSSYPESKRLCETLCTAYHSEYGVPTKVIRLTMTIGPGASYQDARVCAEVARCVVENRDIVLHTLGQTKRNYLYTVDAATAILTVMLAGENGQAYNAANEETYCTIKEMASFVADEIASGKIRVRIDTQNELSYGYAPVLKMNLDTTKLRQLGWSPKHGLRDMFERLCEDMREKTSVLTESEI